MTVSRNRVLIVDDEPMVREIALRCDRPEKLQSPSADPTECRPAQQLASGRDERVEIHRSLR